LINDKDKPDKFEFRDEGEEVSYIGLDEARLLAMQVANMNSGDYGRRYSDLHMVFPPRVDEETKEYYRVVLARRLQGEFTLKSDFRIVFSVRRLMGVVLDHLDGRLTATSSHSSLQPEACGPINQTNS
jgi:hypothetical protein